MNVCVTVFEARSQIVVFCLLRAQKHTPGVVTAQRKSKNVPPRSSSSCATVSTAGALPGSPRAPLKALFGTRRSLSSAHCRTDSPSPHRVAPSRQPLSVRAPTVPVLPPRTTFNSSMRRSASQEAAAVLQGSGSNATAARVKTKTIGGSTAVSRGKVGGREKTVAAAAR